MLNNQLLLNIPHKELIIQAFKVQVHNLLKQMMVNFTKTVLLLNDRKDVIFVVNNYPIRRNLLSIVSARNVLQKTLL